MQFKYYYDQELAKLLADKIKPFYAKFNKKEFVSSISREVKRLELKARVALIADRLKKYLPQDYKSAVNVLLNILGPENRKESGMYKEYYWLLPVAYFVEKYGLDDFATSMNAIYEITKRNTGEYAIRPFLRKYPVKTVKIMKKWSKDKSVHVRRLASEGTRPRLPWAQKLDQFIENPAPIIPILENLKEDSSMFVKKSVANHLNDILKDNQEIAMGLLAKWCNSKNSNTRWIIKHALRNEIKKGNRQALEIIERS